MIEADHLSKTFYLPAGKRIDAVRNVSLRIGPGEIYGLLGPNGAGKTTLLRMLGTILSPSSGTCRVAGIPAEKDPRNARRHIGFLSGNTRLYGRLTPWEILRYFGSLYGMSKEAILSRGEELAGVLDMAEFMDRRCELLSTGQRQKVSIARVLLHDPQVLILDEPTLGLDILTSQHILEFIEHARTRGRTVIFSTHYMTEAELLCTRIGLIHQGKILAEGTLSSLQLQTGTSNLKDAFFYLISCERQ